MRPANGDFRDLLRQAEQVITAQHARETASQDRIRHLAETTTALEKKCVLLFHQIEELRGVLEDSECGLSELEDLVARIRGSFDGLNSMARDVAGQSEAVAAQAGGLAADSAGATAETGQSDVVLIDEAMSCIHRLREQIQAR